MVVIAAGGILVAWAFAQFAAEGVGVPIPGEPNSRRLTVGGPYRYVRNPLYLASVAAVAGQALLLSRPVLLVYAAAFLAISFFLVHWIEDPALARRFGQHFEDYRNQVPGWWPRVPRRTPRRAPNKTTKAGSDDRRVPDLCAPASGSRSCALLTGDGKSRYPYQASMCADRPARPFPGWLSCRRRCGSPTSGQ